jgi:putative nucleotidyltransferase with HDIG domain
MLAAGSYLCFFLLSDYENNFHAAEFIRIIAIPTILNIIYLIFSFNVIRDTKHFSENFKDNFLCIMLSLITFNVIFSNYKSELLMYLMPATICITGFLKKTKLIRLVTILSILSIIFTEIETYLFLGKNIDVFLINTAILISVNILTCHMASVFVKNEVTISEKFMVEFNKRAENISELNNEIIDIQETVILSVAEIIEAKSPQTGQHVKRVSEYVRLLCNQLGYSSSEMEKIRIASMLHDIGKLSIPAEILEKKEKLTDSEYEIMKTHVTEGEKILSKTPGETMQLARIIALEHHEKWDGSGYLHMKNEEINKISRIVAVADVFDALVSSRSYKASWKPEKAYEYMISQSGKHFDPWVIEGFIKCYPDMVSTLKKFPENINF